MSEFNEPWSNKDDTVRDSKREFVMGATPWITEEAIDYLAPSPDKLDRIVACVNFCRNIPTGVLQFYGAPFPDEAADRTPAIEWARTVAND